MKRLLKEAAFRCTDGVLEIPDRVFFGGKLNRFALPTLGGMISKWGSECDFSVFTFAAGREDRAASADDCPFLQGMVTGGGILAGRRGPEQIPAEQYRDHRNAVFHT